MHTKLKQTPQGLYQLTTPVSRDEFVALAASLLRPQLTGPLLNSTQTVGQYLQLRLSNPSKENCAVLLLDAGMRLLHCAVLSGGSLNSSIVHPRDIAKLALEHHASAVIFSHNHPSGGLTPSTEDIQLTFALHSALAVLDIALLDHLIVSYEGFMSFAEAGLL